MLLNDGSQVKWTSAAHATLAASNSAKANFLTFKLPKKNSIGSSRAYLTPYCWRVPSRAAQLAIQYDNRPHFAFSDTNFLPSAHAAAFQGRGNSVAECKSSMAISGYSTGR